MKKYRIITLGYAGGQICNTLLLKGVDAGCLEHFGADPIQSGYLIIKDKFVLRKSMVGVESTDYKVMDELFKTYLDEFKQVIEPNICYFSVCGLGGRTGAGLAVNLTKLLIEQKKEFSILVTIPSRFEGERRLSNALRAFAELDSLAGNQLIPTQLEEIRTQDMKVNELLKKANQCMVERIQKLMMK